MNSLIFLVLVGTGGAAAVTHLLHYHYMASSGVTHFPNFVSLGMLDGVHIDYYDSDIKKVVPKQDWMANTEGPEYWEKQTEISIRAEKVYKHNIEIAKQRFNQSGGVHIAQRMYGCKWDDETGEFSGFNQFGYDGEDFISLDMKTETWIAPKPQALMTKMKLDFDKNHMLLEEYLTHRCLEWLKKYLDYGKSSLRRTELPKVSLLQKTSSSPVSCHATGFYPDRADLLWRKDGAELHDDVVKGEILPNPDGTFQMSVDLDVSSVRPEDWGKYDCVFQLSGAEDMPTKLDKAVIRTNEGNSMAMILPIIVALAVLGVIAVIGVVNYKRKTAKHAPSPAESCEVQEQMILKA